MNLDNVFKKTTLLPRRKTYIPLHPAKPEVPKDLLRKCNKCKAAILTEDVKQNYYICPKCGGYFRINAYRRVEMIADAGSFEEWDKALVGGNPLHYKGYEDKIRGLQEKTGLSEAVVTGKVKIDGQDAVLGICDGRFMMASMGEAVGEKITRAVERATAEKLPVILFACSGGARMQEGIVSLMQMAKTSAALKRHSDAGLLYISVLTDPTTGGVTASFAMQGDIILAEPKALIGFAGPRVIEQTIGEKLPEGFQSAEFLLEHGFVDGIVERPNMRETLSRILKLHAQEPGHPGECPELPDGKKEAGGAAAQPSRKKSSGAQLQPLMEKTPWERVQISRRNDRPVGSDYISALFTDFVELHGDRCYGDDKAILGGVAKVCGRPVICLVDTPGAFCGLEAEMRGQGEAIARNLYEMSGLKVPILSIVIGEGGSGGALAMAVADEVWMLENSIYSILSPEGFASILWRDSSKAKEAAQVMKLTAQDLLELGVIEAVLPEPEPFTTASLEMVTEPMKGKIQKFLETYEAMSEEELTAHRYERFRRM